MKTQDAPRCDAKGPEAAYLICNSESVVAEARGSLAAELKR